MRSRTPSPTTYSALASSVPPVAEDIDSGLQKENFAFQDRCRTPNPRAISRHSFLIRVIIFSLLEFGFIAFVSTALWRPIILHLSFTVTEVKGTLTAITILWHTLAVYVVKDILLSIFSAEWIEQYRTSRDLGLRELDSVSRLTTGFLDQTGHFTSKRATFPFRLGFLAFLLLIVLKGLGPGAISVDFAPYEYPQSIEVANLTITPSFDQFGIETLAYYRANFITQLEVIENSRNYGFHIVQPNMLIPWPSDPVYQNTTIRYHSDVIQYNFSCSWKKPANSQDGGDWVVEDREWYIYFPAPGVEQFEFIDPIILPMQISISPDKPDNNSLIPFFFVGSQVPRSIGIDLTDIPSVPIPCNTTDNPTFVDGKNVSDCDPLLVSVLVCDPQFAISPAVVQATASFLAATILPGDPIVKNIPIQGANVIFSKSLLEATSSMQSYGDQGFANGITRQLFLTSLILDGPTGTADTLLPLEKINENMNNVLASSAKAYLSGYKPNEDNITIPSFAKINTSAMIEVQKMALVGSKPYLLVSSILIGLLIVLQVFIVATTRPDKLETFELQNILKVLHPSDGSGSSGSEKVSSRPDV